MPISSYGLVEQRFRKVENGHWRAALSEPTGSGVGRGGRKPETALVASLAGRSLRVRIVKERARPLRWPPPGSTDNGATEAGANGIRRGWKGQLWEGRRREPAIAYWPGRISPDRPRDRKLDGMSFFRRLSMGETLGERQLFRGHGERRAVRRGHWKLTPMPGENPILADLKADPGKRPTWPAPNPRL